METTVIHVKDFDPARGDVYIGRAVPRRGFWRSPWANPFPIGEEHNRASVIAHFRNWVLTSAHPDARWIRNHVHQLRGKRLACWCKGKGRENTACHGDVLAELADREGSE